ncbi:MAG: hypothetical protein ACKOPN_09340 [Prochlorococcaceae cyanobacterium]
MEIDFATSPDKLYKMNWILRTTTNRSIKRGINVGSQLGTAVTQEAAEMEAPVIKVRGINNSLKALLVGGVRRLIHRRRRRFN